MSSEPDYNFTETASSNAGGSSLQLPFALLASTLAVVMFAQVLNSFNNRATLREGKNQLIQGKAQLAEAYQNREPVVKQSAEVQTKLQELVMDLLLLSKTDEDAKAIVTKYNIQQQVPPAAATPAP